MIETKVGNDRRGLSEYYDPEAPVHYGKDRRCDMKYKCKVFAQTARFGQAEVGKVHPYAQVKSGVMLCEMCERERVRRDMTHRKFAGLAEEGNPKKGKGWGGRRIEVPRLRELREARGLSQVALASMSGINVSTLRKIETNRKTSTKMAQMCAKGLGVPLSELEEA